MSNALARSAAIYEATLAAGVNALACDFSFSLDGFENTYVGIKEFPIPVLTQKESVVVALPGGGERAVNSSIQNLYDSNLTIYENDKGTMAAMLAAIAQLPKSHRQHGWVYNGDPKNWTRRHRIKDIHFVTDTPTGDFEGQSQTLNLSVSIKYAYFFEIQKRDDSQLSASDVLVEAGITLGATLLGQLSDTLEAGVNGAINGAVDFIEDLFG